MGILRNFADGLGRLRRILIRSYSVAPYPQRKWRRLQRRWMLDMSRHLCCQTEEKLNCKRQVLGN